MRYEILIMPRAVKQLKKLPKQDRQRLDRAILSMEDDMTGDVKRLVNHDPRFRLRVGEFRVLFNVEGQRLIIHQVSHRREAY